MTNKVVYKTSNIKRKIFRAKNLNFISSLIIFDLRNTFFLSFKLNLENLYNLLKP